MKEIKELEKKPCPFCGEETKIGRYKDYFCFSIYCAVCDARGPATPFLKEGTYERAVELWNKRV